MDIKVRLVTIIVVLLWAIVSVAGGDGVRKPLTYLKQEGDKWVSVTRGPEGLTVQDEGLQPDRKNMAFQNSGLFLPYVAYPVGSWPEAVVIGEAVLVAF